MKNKETAYLVLADGSYFKGFGIGCTKSLENPAVGEVVFNTSMYGYQEILTDPSYAGQIMTFTSPHIGNVGINSLDVESTKLWVEAVVIRNLCDRPSNYRSERSLEVWLKSQGVMGIVGVDTRQLTLHIRDRGAQPAALALAGKEDIQKLQEVAKRFGSMEGKSYLTGIPTPEKTVEYHGAWTQKANAYESAVLRDKDASPHIVALDFGMKENIERLLTHYGFRVTRLPGTSSVDEVLAHKPDGVFLSNGPGDPAALSEVVQTIKSLIGTVPIFGICLGHQLLALASGAKTYKLKFGHRGANHPILQIATGKIEITSQNHGFAVSNDQLPDSIQVTHVNLNDHTVAGLEVKGQKAFSVQYHPESSPGPHDSRYLFEKFYRSVTSGAHVLSSTTTSCPQCQA